MELAFSQQFCTVVPVKAGGNLNAGPKRFPCLVQVGGVLKAAATAGGPTSLRTARELSKAFADALVSQGVIDRRKARSR